MALATMPLSNYIEMWSQYEDGLTLNEKIEKGRPKLFDFSYPIFDEAYRKVFETHFIKNFYMREIGQETEGLFKLRLENWLNINMPFYNQMFKSELLVYDPLTNTKVETTHNRKNETDRTDNRDVSQQSNTKGNATSDTDSTGKQNVSSTSEQTGSTTDDNFDREINSDTPQNRLELTSNDGQGVIEYASSIQENATNNKQNTTANGKSSGEETSTQNVTDKSTSNVDSTATQNDKLTSDINEVEDYIENRFGKIGTQSYAQLVNEFRSTFLNIERDIFIAMDELFYQLYS